MHRRASAGVELVPGFYRTPNPLHARERAKAFFVSGLICFYIAQEMGAVKAGRGLPAIGDRAAAKSGDAAARDPSHRHRFLSFFDWSDSPH
jgi:hypothetical protein